MIKKTLKINGVERILILDKDETLAQVLREHLLLTGCKIGCGEGHCGACNVIMNGKVTRSCIYKMSRVPDNAEITTIEGVGTISDMHPIQVAWMAYGCAQCGFCSPGFIISAKVLLDNNPSPTREEVRDWFNKQRNLCRCTGYKPLIDATMAAAAVMRGEMTKEDLVFKQTGDSIVGTNYIRPSAAQKVTGTWDFGADDALKMPEGTLRLALTQAKVSHANILSIDTTEAESMPGVVRVITAKDIKAAGGTNKINGLVMLPKHNKTDGFERPVLCDEKIFQFGDAIAIVAADTEEHARAAADAVKVEIEELPAYMNAMDAIAPDAAEIHPGTPNAFFETNCIKGPDFDWDSIPDSQQVEIESYCSRQPHLHLEPDCGYGYIDEDGMITVHSKSIGIHLHMPMIADGIGVPMENLRLVQNHAGGTFGYKFSPTNEALIGAAVKILERPVSLVFNQFQNITYTGKRSPAFMNIKLAADENGKLLALWGNNYVDHGPYSEFGDLLTMRLSQFTGAGYGINSIRNKSTTVFTNHAWGSAFRAYGSPQSYMGSEIAIDVLAAKMGIDPFDIREMNCYKESEAKADGIILQYNGEAGLEEAINTAVRNGIPVVTVMSDAVHSRRQSFVGVSDYQLGMAYGEIVAKYVDENTKKILILQKRDIDDMNESQIYTQISNAVKMAAGSEDIEIKGRNLLSTGTFETEEAVTDIFQQKRNVPDILVCMDEETTECARQAILDFNLAGKVKIIGYYTSEDILAAVEKGVISVTCDVDTTQLGQYSVEAVTSYIEDGRTNSFYNVDINFLDRTAVKKMRREAVTDEKDPLE